MTRRQSPLSVVDENVSVSALKEDAASLEVEVLRYRVKELESLVSLSRKEIESKSKLCVNLEAALQREVKRKVGIPSRSSVVSVPPLSGVISDLSPGRPLTDPFDDTLERDGQMWERLRLDFLNLLDQLERTKIIQRETEESLKTERQRRLQDVEKLKRVIQERDQEIYNYKTTVETQLRRSVETEDQILKPKPVRINRTFSPPIPETVNPSYTRSYISLPPPSLVPVYSPVLMSRQILPQTSPQNVRYYNINQI
jgi:hypothetical protein